MKKTKHILFATGLSVLLTCPSLQANEFNFHLGLGYSSSGSDVTDFYESNFASKSDSLLDGLGGSLRISYRLDNRVRIDFGTGNIFYLKGDLTYIVAPLNITAGYDFPISNQLNVYTRAGLVYKFYSSGNNDVGYQKEQNTGFIIAAGAEYRSFFMELSANTAKSDLSVSNGAFTRSTSINGGINFTIGTFF